jgi:hypothetical protein
MEAYRREGFQKCPSYSIWASFDIWRHNSERWVVPTPFHAHEFSSRILIWISLAPEEEEAEQPISSDEEEDVDLGVAPEHTDEIHPDMVRLCVEIVLQKCNLPWTNIIFQTAATVQYYERTIPAVQEKIYHPRRWNRKYYAKWLHYNSIILFGPFIDNHI